MRIYCAEDVPDLLPQLMERIMWGMQSQDSDIKTAAITAVSTAAAAVEATFAPFAEHVVPVLAGFMQQTEVGCLRCFCNTSGLPCKKFNITDFAVAGGIKNKDDTTSLQRLVLDQLGPLQCHHQGNESPFAAGGCLGLACQGHRSHWHHCSSHWGGAIQAPHPRHHAGCFPGVLLCQPQWHCMP